MTSQPLSQPGLLPRDAAAGRQRATGGASLPVWVARVTQVAEAVIALELVREDGAKLPPWLPGAHVDVALPTGKVRQYSLCGDPDKFDSYRIAVLREAAGRGGSAELHAVARPGLRLNIGKPRHRFPFFDADDYLFIAGGIGITPLLPMVQAAARSGRSWRFVHGGRTRASMAFGNEVARRSGGKFEAVARDEAGHPDIDALLRALMPDTLIYACGPAAMLIAIEDAARRYGVADRLHVERFTAPVADPVAAPPVNRAFEVVLARSGRTLPVPADRSLGSVLRAAQADVSFSCEEGYCGTCETRVIAGEPDHRDSVLSAQDKARNDCMMVCVSRARSARLVIDA
ncbi:MAG: 2Fe-2S iron-sulfur cluster binding domain-containing protein [Rhodopseudomonas sp.]|nr:2Fe-2S iron-sulfur cluster binding domain-containing protein [Rhodopseudomonas sp.]